MLVLFSFQKNIGKDLASIASRFEISSTALSATHSAVETTHSATLAPLTNNSSGRIDHFSISK